ncbi:MAG: STAS domain-containing protein, partial [Roseiflexus sp.]
MHLTQRQINTFLFLLLLVAALAAFADVLTRESELAARVGYGIAIVCVSALLIAYRRGWEPARYVMSLAITLLVALFTVEPYVSQQMDLLHAVPIVIALVLTGPRWVLLNATILLVILLIRGEWSGVYTRPVNLAAYVTLAGGMALSRLAVDSARRLEEARTVAEQERQRAIDALALAQQRADELELRD